MSDFNERPERVYQNKLVKFFTDKLGYKYLGKLQYAKGQSSFADGSVNAPVIESELRTFLSRPGSKYNKYQIDEAIAMVKKGTVVNDLRSGTLQTANNTLYETFIHPIPIQPDAQRPHENVWLFDFQNPLNNDFAIAEEVSYTDPLTGFNARPDIVVYINGIALAVIELKNSRVSLAEGIRQNISNEKEIIPSFFTTVQFTVAASDSNGFRYGTIHTPSKFWCQWKRDDHSVGKPLTDMESFELFFDKLTFFDLFRYGVIYDGGVKKVMRPHQYYALKAAMPRLKEKSSGVIWHSQGSGKSLTMVWLAKYIRRNFNDPRVLVITDRTELDMQINNVFRGTSEPIHRAKTSDDLLETLQDGKEWLICSLIHKFGRHIDPVTKKEIIGDDDAPIPMETYLKELQELVNSKYGGRFTAKGTNKFVFVDECHRTQGGRLHEAMRTIMGADVMFIGFTGTPLLRSQKNEGGYIQYKKEANASENKFGQFIHKYLHKEAVDDGVILDLQYEARDVEQSVSNKDKVDEKLNDILKDVKDEENKEKIQERWATTEHVFSSRERIERIGRSILDDMAKYPLDQDWCNAMLVAGNIYSAYRYYDFFQNICGDKTLRGRCAVVTSYSPSEYDLRKKDDGDMASRQESEYKYTMAKQSYRDLGVADADKYETTAKEMFINTPAQMKLLIVVDKLLTGFDAPNATCLYIDKDMRDHNLFQAVCRVNRLGTDLKEDKNDPDSKTIVSRKEFGLIVDFKHLFNNIKTAVTNFNDGGFSNFDPVDIDGLLEDAISKNKKRLIAALEAYEAMQAEWQRRGLTNDDEIVEWYNPFPSADLDEDSRNKFNEEAKQNRAVFYKVSQALVTAYATIADYILRAGFTEDEAKRIHNKVSYASYLLERVKNASEEGLDVRMYDPKMRDLLDRYIRAEDAETIIPATADFSFLDFLTEDSDPGDTAGTAEKEAGSKKAAAEKIVAKARMVINDWYLKDKAAGKSFAQRLQEIIDEIKKETETTTESIIRLIELIKEMKGVRHTPDGIDSPFAKALWNNRKDWTSLDDDSEVIALVKKVEDFFQTQVYAGWKDPSELACDDCLSGLQNLLDDYYSRLDMHPTMEQIYEVYHIAVNNLND